MSLGLTLLDDVVDVYVIGRKLEDTGENSVQLETIKDMEMKILPRTARRTRHEFLPCLRVSCR